VIQSVAFYSPLAMNVVHFSCGASIHGDNKNRFPKEIFLRFANTFSTLFDHFDEGGEGLKLIVICFLAESSAHFSNECKICFSTC
jgi:hypothetical protein